MTPQQPTPEGPEDVLATVERLEADYARAYDEALRGRPNQMPDIAHEVMVALPDLIARVRDPDAERDSAQEHVAYHLRDYALNSELTGDPAADMAKYAGRLKTRAEQAEAEVSALRATVERVEALRDSYEADAANEDHGGELWSTTAGAITAALDGTDR